MATAKIEFRICQHNVTPEGEEVIFSYNGKWYRIKAEDMPATYHELRKLKLWLEEGKLFDSLAYVDLSKPAIVEVDLDKAEEIAESYPL